MKTQWSTWIDRGHVLPSQRVPLCQMPMTAPLPMWPSPYLNHPDVIADVGDAVVVAGLSDKHPVTRLEALEGPQSLGKQRQLPTGLALDHADAEGGEGDERLAVAAQGPGVDNVNSLRSEKLKCEKRESE